MSKLLFVFFIFISSLLAQDTIRIVYNSGTPPLKFKDSNNNASGMLIDIWKLWAQKNNKKIEFIEASWEETINMIKTNRADVHAGIYYTKERDKYLDYTSKVLYNNNKYFFFKKEIGEINKIDDIKPYVVAVDNGYPIDFMIENYPKFAIQDYASANEANNGFFQGDTKVVLASLPTFFYYLKRNGFDEKNYSYNESTYAYTKQYFGAVKQGNTKLLKTINDGFKNISNEEISLIELKWTKDLDLKNLNIQTQNQLINSEELQHLNKKEKIKMCVDPSWLPFEAIEDGKHIGLVAEILKLYEKNLEYPIELVSTKSWAQTLEYAKNRECDIISAAAATENRKKYMSFTIPYLKFPQVIVTREKEPFIDDFKNVINRKIGVVKNSAIAELLVKKYPEINLINVDNVADGLFKVSSGELYGFVNTTAAVSYGIAKNGMTNLKIASKTGIDYFLRTAIRNDEPLLLNIFNKVISQTDKSSIEEIKDNWLRVKMEEVVDYTLFYQLFGLFIIVVAFVLYWNRKLHIEIDERKAAQEQTNKFLQVIEQSQISIMITDKTGTIEYANPYSQKETGYFLEELVGAKPSILKSGYQDSDFYKDLWGTILSGKTWTGEFSNKKKNGEYFWESAIIAPIFDEDGRIKYFTSIKEDITEDKRVQKELEIAQKEAESANKAKSDFLAKMSHEIRTPMNAVLGMLYLLEKTSLNNIQENYIKKAHGAANSLLGVINDILDFSKIEANKLDIKNEDFNIHQNINDIMSVMSVKAEEKQLELLTYYDKNFPINVVSDSLRFTQILNNLLSNALKFTQEGEVLLSTKVVSKNDEEATLMFCIRDTGIGISKENQNKLFQEFSQVDDSATRSFHGTGLGLAISKKLTNLLGGDIWVEDSKEDVGTTICFTIKVGLASCSLYKEFEFPTSMSNLKVLVVDDNELAAEVLSQMLESFDYKVDIVYSGLDAVNKVQENNYDIVFLDYKMPGLNGIETYKEYKEILEEKTPKTILVTAFSQELIEKDVEKYGILGYLTKPMSPSTLYDSIIEALNTTQNVIPKLNIQKKKSEQKLEGQKVLLVEDNVLNQEFAIPMLQAYGLEVSVANDGLEAMQKVQDKTYSLVLMDIQMPKLDGLEATRRIRLLEDEYFKSLPIIALSANALVGDKEKSIDAGMNEHITKPINPDKLFEVLKEYIGEVEPLELIEEVVEFIYIAQIDKNILDTNEAMDRMANNEKAYIKILEQFYTNYEKVFEYIKTLITTNDIEALDKKIHELKGISGNIAAKVLYKNLEDINGFLIKREMPYMELFKVCENSLNDVLNEIKKLNIDSQDNKSVKFDKEKVIELLFEMKNYLEIDIVKCEEQLEVLSPFLKGDYDSILDDISTALNEFDTDRVNELIENFLEELNND